MINILEWAGVSICVVACLCFCMVTIKATIDSLRPKRDNFIELLRLAKENGRPDHMK